MEPSRPRTLVVPMFREAARICATVEVIAASPLADGRTEVLLVDDGSDDGTSALARDCLARAGLPGQVLRHEVNRGKGAAVRTGVLAATGRMVVFSDADLSVGVGDIERCFAALETGEHDVVFASRTNADSEIPVPQPWPRQMSGKAFNLLLRAGGLTTTTDTQCGLKGFTAEAARLLFEPLTIERFAFDVEVLWRACQHGLRIHELPVVWRHVEESRVTLARDSMRMLRDVLRLRRTVGKETSGARRSHAPAQV